MKCTECNKELLGYLQGYAGEHQKRNIGVYLDNCQECRDFSLYLTETLRAVEAERSIQPDPFMATRIEAILNSNLPAHNEIKSRPALIQVLAFSLVMLAGVIGGIGIGRILVQEHRMEVQASNEIHLIMNDLQQEPLETFLLGF